MVKDLASWLKETVESAGAVGTVLGLSGGIDSAVVAGISKIAFPDTTLCLMMPIESLKSDEEDARLIAEALDLDIQLVDLTDTYNSLLDSTHVEGSELAKSNIKPRLRSTTLYYYAQSLNYLTLGGTNYSEEYIGYFTKFGDNAVDIQPIAHLTKDEVYKLAEVLEIPQKIIDKKPSAGLEPDQTDEDDLGFCYDYLDRKIKNRDWDKESNLDQKIQRMHQNAEHKRNMPKRYKEED